MGPQRKALGGGAASVYRNPRRRRSQAGIRAAGGALEGLRSGAEWLGIGIRQHPNSQPGIAIACVRAFGIKRRAAAAALRIFSGRADVWYSPAWGNCAGARSRGGAA